jgi:hypothetical protein
MRCAVAGEHIETEVRSGIAPHRVSVVCVALGVVPLDQQPRTACSCACSTASGNRSSRQMPTSGNQPVTVGDKGAVGGDEVGRGLRQQQRAGGEFRPQRSHQVPRQGPPLWREAGSPLHRAAVTQRDRPRGSTASWRRARRPPPGCSTRRGVHQIANPTAVRCPARPSSTERVASPHDGKRSNSSCGRIQSYVIFLLHFSSRGERTRRP